MLGIGVRFFLDGEQKVEIPGFGTLFTTQVNIAE
jgi:hypothetical protein